MRKTYAAWVLCSVLIGVWSVESVEAQDPGSWVLQGGVGAREYILEGACHGGPQNSFGGSLHYYLTPKTTIGPEVLWFSHCRQVFTYYAPRISSSLQVDHTFSEGRVRPYVIGSLGFVSHKSQYAPPQIKFDYAGGGGAKIFASKRVFVAPEVLMGTGATIRYRINVGIVLR